MIGASILSLLAVYKSILKILSVFQVFFFSVRKSYKPSRWDPGVIPDRRLTPVVVK